MTAIPTKSAGRTLFLQVAWRNLWRNRRRTLLTVAAIAVGMFLVQFAMSFQSGSYGPMVEIGTRMGSGHIQILQEMYHDEPRIEYSIKEVAARLQTLSKAPEIETVSARAEAFALISNDPHSTAALINGVIPERERLISDLPTKVVEGTYLTADNQVFIGATLARNLQLDVGGELVVIGTNAVGGIAAVVLEVCGIFKTTAALERTLVQVSLATFQETFEMPDEAHRLVAMVENPQSLGAAAAVMKQVRADGEVVMDWRELMPEISQGIELDIISNAVIQFVLILVIVLSIMNTFVMTLFERTREYGMLFAIGMQRGTAFWMTLVEAVLLCIVGVACGYVLTILIVVPLTFSGIPMPASEAALESQFAFLPTELYPELSAWVILIAPIVIGAGTLIAVSLASIRLGRLNIIQSLRVE